MTGAIRCADCGTALGELHRDHTGDVICLRSYLRRPEPNVAPAPERPEPAS